MGRADGEFAFFVADDGCVAYPGFKGGGRHLQRQFVQSFLPDFFGVQVFVNSLNPLVSGGGFRL